MPKKRQVTGAVNKTIESGPTVKRGRGRPRKPKPPAKPKSKKRDLLLDERGKFKPGNPGGPGRPPAQREAAYLRAVREAVSPEDMSKLAVVLMKAAMKGSIQAARLLCEHLLPKPTDRLRIEQDFTMPWERDESEFRAAGMSPAELDRNVFDFVADLVRREQAARGEKLKEVPMVKNVISEQ